MKSRAINPWQWQNQFGFSQAIEITQAQRVLYCAGQTSSDAEGVPIHAGDMPAQVNQAFDNLEMVLSNAGYSLANVVRLNYYTTDVDLLLAHWDTILHRLEQTQCYPSSTLLEVSRLAFPEFLIEIEATAVQ